MATDHRSPRRSRDFLSPHGSTRTLASVTSRRSQRSATSRRHGNHLSTIRSGSLFSSPPVSPQLGPTANPSDLSYAHVPEHHHHHPQGHFYGYSHATIDTTPAGILYSSGPDHTRCTRCGVDPAILFPRHPWDYPQPWWRHLKQEYIIVKPYLEWQRKEKYRRKQRRREQGKLKTQRFRPRNLQHNWREELKRFGWRLTGWKHWNPREKKPQPQQPSDPEFNLVVDSGEETSGAQDDRDVQGHETRQELLRESEARTHREPADSSNARDGVRRLFRKLESKGLRQVDMCRCGSKRY